MPKLFGKLPIALQLALINRWLQRLVGCPLASGSSPSLWSCLRHTRLVSDFTHSLCCSSTSQRPRCTFALTLAPLNLCWALLLPLLLLLLVLRSPLLVSEGCGCLCCSCVRATVHSDWMRGWRGRPCAPCGCAVVREPPSQAASQQESGARSRVKEVRLASPPLLSPQPAISFRHGLSCVSPFYHAPSPRPPFPTHHPLPILPRCQTSVQP